MNTRIPRRLTIEPDGTLILAKPRPTAGDFAASVVAAPTLGFASALALGHYADGHADWTPLRVAVTLGCGIGGLIAAALGIAVDALRAPRGMWRFGADGVEFIGSDGTRRNLRWAEVDQVQTLDVSVRLVGSAERCRIDRGGLAADDWQTVRDRVDGALASRFDREPPPADGRFRLPLVLGAAAPFVAAAVVFQQALPRLTIPQILGGFLVIATILGVSIIVSVWSVMRDHARRTWRHPRPPASEENGPGPKMM